MNEATNDENRTAVGGRLEVLVMRLREHEAVHRGYFSQDTEQEQWADDLREAAAEIERMGVHLLWLAESADPDKLTVSFVVEHARRGLGA